MTLDGVVLAIIWWLAILTLIVAFRALRDER